MIYALLIYGVLLAFYHVPNYMAIALHRMHYYLTGESNWSRRKNHVR